MTEFVPPEPPNPEQQLWRTLSDGLPLGYILGGEIGRGAHGIVYHADHYQHRQGCESVAVKVLNAPGNLLMQRRFREEGDFLHDASHPNIIGVQQVGSVEYHHPGYQKADDVPFIIMDRAHGSLNDVVWGGSKPTAHTAIKYAMQAMNGLGYVHNDQGDANRKTHVHLDVKPGNLLLAKNTEGKDEVKVADFGITRLSDTQIGNENTETDVVQGTFQYMSPEQFEGNVLRSCDIYAMGVVSYQLLARKLPILGGESAISWYNAHRDQQPPVIDTRQRPQAEARLIDMVQLPIAKALQKAPSDRFGTMTEFRETVQEAVRKAAEADKKAKTFITNRPVVPPRTLTKTYTDEPFAQPPPRGETRHYTGAVPPAPLPGAPRFPTITPPSNGPVNFEPTDWGKVLEERPISTPGSRPETKKSIPEPASSPEGSGFGRRAFLGLLGLAGAAVVGYGGIKTYDGLFGVPNPTEKASPEQAATDYIAKNIMDALVNGGPGDKDQAGLILRELIHLNPEWAVEQAPGMALTYDFELGFQRRLFQEYPRGAYDEYERMKREGYSWRAIQLMGTFAAEYTPIGKAGDKGQEDHRILAHQKYNNMGTQLGIMLADLKAQDNPAGGISHEDERRILWSIYSPDKPFNANTLLDRPPVGPTETITDVVNSLIEKDNPSGIEVIGAALAPKNPAMAKRILGALIDRAFKVDDSQSWAFVDTLSDAMAQYSESRSAVIDQMYRLSDDKHKSNSTLQTATRMAVSVGPFDAQATTNFVNKNSDQPSAHLALLAVGDKGQQVVRTVRDLTTDENKPWFDLAIDPTNRNTADTAIDALKNNPELLRDSGNVIGAALVAGRRFAD
jgi:serine/threonine protein kinase